MQIAEVCMALKPCKPQAPVPLTTQRKATEERDALSYLKPEGDWAL